MVLSRYLNNLLLILLIAASFGDINAQGTTDDQLAAYYYREGSFDKAVIYYDRLYENNPSDDNYNYLLKCFLALEDYKSAEKLAENQVKKHPSTMRYKVDVGTIYNKSGDESKAEKEYSKIIKSLDKASVSQILELGKAFSEIDENQLALEVYYKGRKQVGKAYPFNFQIAQILGQQGNIEGMITEYLDVLEISTGYIQSVQNTLNRVIGFDEESKYNAILKEQLMLRIQKNPESDIYSQMLIWALMQQNKYEAAMIQVKALDKRNKEDGQRVVSLAKIAVNNYKYDVAIDGYNYLKSKGPNNYYYTESYIAMLEAMKLKVINSAYSESSINQLILEYQKALEEFGRRPSTSQLIVDFAHIKAFYQSKYNNAATQEAIELLQNGLSIPGLDDRQLAFTKIELADIYVLTGFIWDASLLYGQVEKKFKYDEIGFEAKLKNAKVFYYSGDFGWSEAQLDALKGSTSKLISNDALELSVFISDNTGLDTTTEALSIFSKSELMLAQHKYDSALYMLGLIESNFPGHELSDNILFQKAAIANDRGDYPLAIKNYMAVYEKYPSDILADNALIEAGRLYETALNDKEKAMGIYETILTEYSSSLFVVEARKRFRSLRGDFIQ
ncbi:MAG TPA: hypothetical protein DCR48_01810 [Flavobacteriales bacterium]|nr:hypothetical protein [Salibacteraceae bacterium]HAQ69688.1 hypothetical protein [Flavobacteriales bacterium]